MRIFWNISNRSTLEGSWHMRKTTTSPTIITVTSFRKVFSTTDDIVEKSLAFVFRCPSALKLMVFSTVSELVFDCWAGCCVKSGWSMLGIDCCWGGVCWGDAATSVVDGETIRIAAVGSSLQHFLNNVRVGFNHSEHVDFFLLPWWCKFRKSGLELILEIFKLFYCLIICWRSC